MGVREQLVISPTHPVEVPFSQEDRDRLHLLSREASLSSDLTLVSVAESASFTIDGAAHLYIVDSAAGSIVVTVPLAATFPDREFTIKNYPSSGSEQITLSASGSDTFDVNFGSSKVINAGDAVRIHSDGSSVWWLV